jgi:peptidyl-prolyl cis-trans isomerase B (cyclophilin B)
MKTSILATVAFLASWAFAAADDVAVMTLRFGKDKKTETVVIEFREEAAPQTVENFKKLARKRFYNGLAMHRVFANTLVQTGDPFSRHKDRSHVGTGGPGYTLPAEIRLKHETGSVAMARLGDNLNPARRSNGSQFFVTLKPMPELDGQYTVFGKVVSGLETLVKASARPADSNDSPLDRVEVKSVRLVPREKAGL